MSDQNQAVPTPAEMTEYRRKCWCTECNRTSRLEWCGWRYCVRHFWTYILRDDVGWRGKLVKLRWTRIIVRH